MQTPRFAFPPDPAGWYHLAESSDVATGASPVSERVADRHWRRWCRQFYA